MLRGPYKRNEYRKVVLPLTVLRRFDGLLAPTNAKALETFTQYKSKPESIVRSVMQGATGYPFYNLSKLEFRPSQQGISSLLDDPSNLAQNLNSYINAFSPNVRAIMERFAFDQQIVKMAEKNLWLHRLLHRPLAGYTAVAAAGGLKQWTGLTLVFDRLGAGSAAGTPCARRFAPQRSWARPTASRRHQRPAR